VSSTSTQAQRPTAAQAESMWREWKTTGSTAARDRLVLSYAPMVRYLTARKMRELPARCELEDLVSCGMLALVAAVDRFDPKKGATFEQFAWTRVTGAIVDELRRHDWASRSVRRKAREVESAREKFAAKEGRPPSEDELASSLEIGVGELRERLSEVDRADIVSLNSRTRRGDDTDLVEIGDLVVAPPGDHEPELATLTHERTAALARAIRSLTDRERRVLELVHVHDTPGAVIAAEFGVTESRVSQILSSVRAKLAQTLADYEAAAGEAA
jgi:RNA polymerase sigma factor FliA